MPILIWKALALIALTGALLFGWHQFTEHYREEGRVEIRAQIAKETKEAEERGRKEAYEVADEYAKTLENKRRKADNELSLLRPKLAALDGCVVPAATVRMLDPDSDGKVTPPTSGASAATAPTDSTCGQELAICARNYREVCNPNAEQLGAIQKLYNKVAQ